MRVKDINSKETIQDLTDRGFQLYKGEKIGCQLGTEYYCWFGGKKRNGNESPTLMRDSQTGDIWFKQTVTYYQRRIPDVLLFMIQRGKIEESDVL